jgi:hypothetical protein
MHVQADVAPGLVHGLSGVQAHPHPQRCAVRPGMPHERSLRRHRRPRRIPGPRERHQEGIALRVDLLPVSLGKRLAEESAVFLQDLCLPPVPEPLEEVGVPLDVREQEGDRPGREPRHMPLSVPSEESRHLPGDCSVILPSAPWG